MLPLICPLAELFSHSNLKHSGTQVTVHDIWSLKATPGSSWCLSLMRAQHALTVQHSWRSLFSTAQPFFLRLIQFRLLTLD